MDAGSRRQKRQDDALALLNMAIEAVNLAKEISSITPAKVVFGSVGVLLTMIRVRSPILRGCILSSRAIRTRWSIKPITSSSG